MPLFHFHIIGDGKREHVGSMDLPSRGEAIPAGLQLVTRILAVSARGHGGGEGLSIQATDEAGAVVYNFDVSRRSKRDAWPIGYLH